LKEEKMRLVTHVLVAAGLAVGGVALAECVDLADVREVDGDGVPVMEGALVEVCAVITVAKEFGGSGPGYCQNDDGAVAIWSGAYTDADVSIGDEVVIQGVVGFYRGLTEIINSTEVEVVGSPGAPPPELTDLATINVYPEDWEARLITLQFVELVDPENWPAEGSSYNLTITQGGETLTMRVDSDTDIDGSPAPTEPFHVTGVVCQYDSSSPYWSGYQIMPRGLFDFDFDPTVDAEEVPYSFELLPAYPNPFNPSTTLSFTLPETQDVRLAVFNSTGTLVSELVNGRIERGEHSFSFSGENLSSGIYFYTLQSGKALNTQKMLLIK